MPINTTLERTPPSLPGQTPDNTVPTVGGGLEAVNPTSSGFTLNWTKGSDDQTVESQLRYLVYISAQDNITGVSNAENNGTLLNSDDQDQLDINTYQVSGRDSEKQYWATAILKDQAGNKSAYAVVTETTTAPSADGLDSTEGDIAALEALYVSAGGDTWENQKNYHFSGATTGDATGWAASGMVLDPAPYGVTVVDGRVTRVELEINNLEGTLPPELQNLKQCTFFNVMQNLLTGDLPAELGGMSSLIHLYLAGRTDKYPHETYDTGGYHAGKTDDTTNFFTGTIPPELFTSTIKTIRLERQINMSGGIPSEIGNATAMEGFMIYGKERTKDANGFHNSGFSGQIPPEIGNCTSLKVLSIGRNQFEGPLPSELGNCSDMRAFWMGANNITGGFPSTLTNWKNIVHIFASRWAFDGAFPDFFFDGTHTSLNTFLVSWGLDADEENGFTGQMPSMAGTNMNHFAVVDHKMTGSIHPDIPTDINPELFQIGWQKPGFGFSGQIPQTGWANWDGLREMRLNNNNLEGPVPTEWSQMQGRLNLIAIGNNKFVFADIIPLLEEGLPTPNNDIPLDFQYSPQQNFGNARSEEVDTGNDITLDFPSYNDHVSDVYQWQKGGEDIAGATSLTYTITGADSGDEGDYTLVITNPDAPDLTLTSNTIVLTVN